MAPAVSIFLFCERTCAHDSFSTETATSPTDITAPVKKGCVADPMSCLVKRPAGCKNSAILLQATLLVKNDFFVDRSIDDIDLYVFKKGQCEPIPGTDGYDGVCVWGTPAERNCEYFVC